jgi:hypothetical protein
MLPCHHGEIDLLKLDDLDLLWNRDLVCMLLETETAFWN